MVCLVLGAAAGHSALAAPLSDFTVMTEAASMFTGGPPLVKAAIGEEVTKEELGGPRVCAEIAGTAHNVVDNDSAAIDLARRYLSYFPSHRDAPLPRKDGGDCGPRRLDAILDVVPPQDRVPYSMHTVIEMLVDTGTFLEIQPDYGRAMITGLAFLGGCPVAIVANQPLHAAGALDAAAAIKAGEFLETVGHFAQPVIFLADNPGVMAGSRAERDGILKWGGRLFRAERRLRNAKLHVLLRKAFGFGAVTMAGTPFDRQTITYAFPSVTLTSMPAASGGRAAKLDAETQAAVEEDERAGAYRLANRLGIDEVIDPRELRNALLAGLMLSEGRRR
jgi:acetyl-CoA carboxylase carboxyltransferase component